MLQSEVVLPVITNRHYCYKSVLLGEVLRNIAFTILTLTTFPELLLFSLCCGSDLVLAHRPHGGAACRDPLFAHRAQGSQYYPRIPSLLDSGHCLLAAALHNRKQTGDSVTMPQSKRALSGDRKAV